MLVEFKVQNFRSFNKEQTLSMLASSSTRESYNDENLININKFGVTSTLKSVAIFGANASGKTNIGLALSTFKSLVLFSLREIDSEYIKTAIPFFIKEELFDIPTEFEVTFVIDNKMYRYGISIKDGLISEEWLYVTSISRETMLFHRNGEIIDYNKKSFSEAKSFVKKVDEVYFLEQTKQNIPFISVVAQFNGEVSSKITKWFKNLNVISGVTDDGIEKFTTDLFQESDDFKEWALAILQSLQIQDIEVIEEEQSLPTSRVSDNDEDEDLVEAAYRLEAFIKRNAIKNKKINVVKEWSGKKFSFPVTLESDGTKKIVYILGPLYDTIIGNKVLFIDEFDSKFHSLLSEFIIKLFHKESNGESQLIMTCHDTNLLNKNIFRRDQIWFVEKNENHESEIFSLIEYKEHYTRKDSNYSKDYLSGKYGAIPLFSSLEDFVEVLHGKG